MLASTSAAPMSSLTQDGRGSPGEPQASSRQPGATAQEQRAHGGRGEEPDMPQPSLKAQTYWLCPETQSPSTALLSCCSALAPKRRLKMGARKGSIKLGSPSWAGPFLAWLVLQKEVAHSGEGGWGKACCYMFKYNINII